MTSHRQILVNLARAIQADERIASYCTEHFGRALAINVGAYANGIPGEDSSPFLWIHAADDENESVGDDETFVARLVVAGCVKGPDGEQYIETVEVPRSETVNGLTVNGGNQIVEDLRDIIVSVVRSAKAGAYPIRIRRVENDISHFPLEWAEFYVEYNEPETLN